MQGRKTNIQVDVETRDKLADLGKKGDSFADIVKRLLEFYYEHQ
jgi:predicted CopG family antitoxin